MARLNVVLTDVHLFRGRRAYIWKRPEERNYRQHGGISNTRVSATGSRGSAGPPDLVRNGQIGASLPNVFSLEVLAASPPCGRASAPPTAAGGYSLSVRNIVG